MKCVVLGCESVAPSSEGVSLFRFPKQKSQHYEWLANLKPFTHGPIDLEKDRVCQKHFETDSIKSVHGRRYLRSGTCPTLFELHLLKHTKEKSKKTYQNVPLEKSISTSWNDSRPVKIRKSQRLSGRLVNKKDVLVEEAEESPTKTISNEMVKFSETTTAVIANRVFTGATKAIQLTSLKRSSSEDANEKPAKNPKLPFVYALTPSSVGGGTGAQQLTPITRPVTLTKIQGITAMSGGAAGGGVVDNIKPIIASPGVKLVPGTVIKLAGNKKFTIPMMGANGNLSGGVARRPTIYIKAPVKKTIRTVTEESIVKSPKLHVGMTAERLTILKNVAFQKAKIPFVDLLITLKKLRLNESFALLAEYFEYPESEVEKIFTRTVIKLAKYLKFLIRWPDGDKYCERHKNLPITFRSKLSYVQSLIECVETEIRPEACAILDTAIDYKFFKFVLAITPAGVISYVSEAFVGNHDDLAIFNACNFQNLIPKYLSLVADPGQGLTNHRNEFETDSTTDSADETEEHSLRDMRLMRRFAAKESAVGHQGADSNLNIVNSQLTSSKVKDFSIPTLRVREPACRQQIRDIIYTLREFKILQPYAILEPHLYQYINEILVIVSALTNFQR